MLDCYRIIILPKASSELIEVCSYIERDSPQNASSIAQELLQAIDSLERFPSRYKVHEHRRDSAKSVRSMPLPPFVIYYRIDDTMRSHPINSARRETEATAVQIIDTRASTSNTTIVQYVPRPDDPPDRHE